jgi:hypothetical protein
MTTQPRRLTRRTFLRTAAATLVLVVGGGVYRAVDQGVFSVGQGPAYEPWTTWRSDAQPGPLNLVRAAILASNPHNSQPWRFRVSETQIDVYADPSRNIGTVDPFLREMYMGVGCALENLMLAATANGYRAELALLPTANDPTHAARIMLSPANNGVSPLYEAIPNRHTNRGPYDTTRPIAQQTLNALKQLGDNPDVTVLWFATPERRQLIGDLTVAATEVFIADAEQSRDSHQWFRHAWSDIQQQRDGITIDAQSLSPALVTAVKLLPDSGEATGNSVWRDNTRSIHVATAAAFGLLAVRDPRNNTQRLNGGRLWQRMHLWATTQGVAMQPLNQLCERADRELQLGIPPRFGGALRELVGDASWQALMPFRLGYPTVASLPSPRRAAEDVSEV